MKFTDLTVKLDYRASAWKDSKALQNYTIDKAEDYTLNNPCLVDTRWVICEKVPDWPSGYINKPVTFSLGSVEKFIKDNPIIVIEGFECIPVKVQYAWDNKRFGIAFQII